MHSRLCFLERAVERHRLVRHAVAVPLRLPQELAHVCDGFDWIRATRGSEHDTPLVWCIPELRRWPPTSSSRASPRGRGAPRRGASGTAAREVHEVVLRAAGLPGAIGAHRTGDLCCSTTNYTRRWRSGAFVVRAVRGLIRALRRRPPASNGMLRQPTDSIRMTPDELDRCRWRDHAGSTQFLRGFRPRRPEQGSGTGEPQCHGRDMNAL
jgi:hypothetical protein